SAQGDYVPLAEQDTGLWDAPMIDEAEALLAHANRCEGIGRYRLEASVQSAQAARRHAGRADWDAIVQLYDALCALTGSPVAGLNRAVALSQTQGAQTGIEALDALAGDARLASYQPYWAARAELLARCGEVDAADAAYSRAIGLERDAAVRQFLQRRQAALH